MVPSYTSCVCRRGEIYTNPSRPPFTHTPLNITNSFDRSLSFSIMTPGSIEKERSISSDEQKSKPHVATYALDTAAVLVAAEDVILTPEEAKRLRRKIDWHILPLMSSAFIFIFTFTVKRARLSPWASPLLGPVHGQKHPGVFRYLGNPNGRQTHNQRVRKKLSTISVFAKHVSRYNWWVCI